MPLSLTQKLKGGGESDAKRLKPFLLLSEKTKNSLVQRHRFLKKIPYVEGFPILIIPSPLLIFIDETGKKAL